ncbi:MAG: ribosome biogenesis GTP-binding protein YihA/YsxC [Bacteroidales bacterium]
MKITNAAYLTSSPHVNQCPPPERPEFAFIGRSNVGKSSLINKLANKKHLAKTSSTPGKTTLINHFDINQGQMYWVDLPGYGYAKRSKKMIRQLRSMIYGYLQHRSNLLTSFVLLDSRHSPQNIDLEFINWCGANQIPIALILTKADKPSKNALTQNIKLWKQQLEKNWAELPLIFLSSAQTGQGTEDILDFLHFNLKNS